MDELRLRVAEVAQAHGVDNALALARRCDIAIDTAYRLWNNEIGGTQRGGRGVSIGTLWRVARALGVPMRDLLPND